VAAPQQRLEVVGASRKARGGIGQPTPGRGRYPANLKSEHAAIAAKAHAVEVEAAPIIYVDVLFGGTTEQTIRLLILLMVVTCDPFAVALTAAAAAQGRYR